MEVELTLTHICTLIFFRYAASASASVSTASLSLLREKLKSFLPFRTSLNLALSIEHRIKVDEVVEQEKERERECFGKNNSLLIVVVGTDYNNELMDQVEVLVVSFANVSCSSTCIMSRIDDK